MGNRPFGRILYLNSGQMSAQVMGSAIHLFANTDARDATTEEADRAWRNYVGYWGTYTADVETGVVIHTVEGCSFPNWVGQKQVRHFRFTGVPHRIAHLEGPAVDRRRCLSERSVSRRKTLVATREPSPRQFASRN